VRIANLSGRLVLLRGDKAIDVADASSGRFSADPQAIYDHWNEFQTWTSTVDGTGIAFDPRDLGSPVPAPRQVFAVGLNYREHAAESGFTVPDTLPPVFTKFPTAITGPRSTVELPGGGHTDWEVELVAVIGSRAHHARDSWEHVAGLTVGQDLSERITQMAGPVPQFGLGKSFPGFAPIGPCLVTPYELDNPDDLELGCSINGEEMQKGRTSDLIFSVPTLVAKLSAILPLLPGDVIFTGTPAGVGVGRTPQRFLAPGDKLVSYVEGIGELCQSFVEGGA
jgi:2-keto-4-pentenoate hydratase/2-oxohepta-3-ene-1,7-dioic acid hydratase in catechol pathway